VILRQVSLADLPVLASVHARAFQPSWNESEIADLLAGTGAFGLILEDPSPLAMILCRAVAGEGEVLTLAVDPAARRRGYGLALVGEAARRASEWGASEFFLEVAADNIGAVTLYESYGFARVGLRPGYYLRPSGAVDAIIMRCDLNRAAD
jgi:[ribosomal protein S18]-alanine N-acetyltransferase